MNSSPGNAQYLCGMDLNRPSIDGPGQRSVNPVDRFFIMVVAMGGCHQSRPARHHQFEHRNAARRVVAGNEEMDPELSELDDLLGRIDAVLWPFPVPDSFLLRGSSSLHPANSRPYCEAASSILRISRYPGSSAGGKVMAGAGTLNSLNHPSSPAGVSRMSIRSCSDSIVNEWPRSRGKKNIVPAVPLIVRSPTETTTSPSST